MLTDQQHPITPPSPELVERWIKEPGGCNAVRFATKAARWGADQELEACCSWADATGWCGAGDMLRAARRPKPQSLAGEALKDLAVLLDIVKRGGVFNPPDTIRLALERLQELEKGNE